MNEYYMEEIFKFWEKDHHEYHWEVREDSDGLNQVEFVYIDHLENNKTRESRISIPLELVGRVAEAFYKIKSKLENEK
jgi:hypothetical protein